MPCIFIYQTISIFQINIEPAEKSAGYFILIQSKPIFGGMVNKLPIKKQYSNINRLPLLGKPFIKAALLLFYLVCLKNDVSSQTNLVPNPSFEIMNVPCSQLKATGGGALNWHSPNYISDTYSYINSCSSLPCCSVPYNTLGLDYHYPHSFPA